MRLTTLRPRPYEGAFANPMCGFRARWFQFVEPQWPVNDHFTTVREYFPWNAIEPDAGAGVDAILADTERRCPDLAVRNLRLVPRVFLESPQPDGSSRCFWPADMITGDFMSPAFLRRCERLIEKMGQAWDNDPRIAAIEMGLWGFWGEHHLWNNDRGLPFRMPLAVQRVLGDAFAAAFPHNKVLVRYANTFLDYEFGIYWDSFALGTAVRREEARFQARGDYWRRCPLSGETAYNYGDVRETLGNDPTDTVSDPVHRQWLIDWIRDLHASCLGWVSRYNADDPVARAGGDEVQKAFGYRFVVDAFTYVAEIDSDGAFEAALTLRNVGAAPFYYDWPVTLSLLDPKTGAPVWRRRLAGDIRTVQPGDDYDRQTRAYRVAPQPVTFRLKETLPDALRGGAYLAAVSVDDPACGRPALRLACENYKTGGWHPLGVVRFGGGQAALPSFDDIRADRTITYA